LTFVPVDFESRTLDEALRAAGFRADEPAFFSWLGVTMYLTREAVLSTLVFVAGCRDGGVTFDYILPPNRMPWRARIGFWFLSQRLARAGEPWRTWFDPAELKRELGGLGFTRLEDLDGPTLNARYFGGREKRLGGVSMGRVMTARRGGLDPSGPGSRP